MDSHQQEEHEPTAFGCLACGVWFRSKAGEGAHMFRVHGHTAKTRSLFEGTACTVCMREYHTPFKLQAHLRYKRSCREVLIAEGAHYTPQPGKGSTQHMDLEKVHNDLLPVQPASGPRQPTPDGRDWEHVDAHLHLRIADAILDWQTSEDPTPRALEMALRGIATAQDIVDDVERYPAGAHTRVPNFTATRLSSVRGYGLHYPRGTSANGGMAWPTGATATDD